MMTSYKLRSTGSLRFFGHSAYLMVAFAPKKTRYVVYLCFY